MRINDKNQTKIGCKNRFVCIISLIISWLFYLALMEAEWPSKNIVLSSENFELSTYVLSNNVVISFGL